MTQCSFPDHPSGSSGKSRAQSVQENNESVNQETLDIVLALLANLDLSSISAMRLVSAVLDHTNIGATSAATGRSAPPMATTPLAQVPSPATATSSPLVSAPPSPSPARTPPTPSPTSAVGAAPAPAPVLIQTYQGWAFNVPEPGVQGQYYLVTRGRRIGIFVAWQTTSPYVTGVSHATYTRISSVEARIAGMRLAIDNGEVEILQ
ncbi:hypothetical protein SERLA73DRAFT_75083 [Serpula lacrymans var. lacrymans S7.3]|uniref:Ribonuclease H1 N-terminal domain-containing protein n=2 Tax=Serpula lacrymans var. lacrymans TaxID=341189 RepID=F8Q2I4_SERL3|nr:uncharacterized protein SERLADRAFT_439749 [Serpula lacrymans var. lacrymans S7.9]EGN97395.1 hypothetical protein SERLA73DRAFT_75083 [Serpula lacrymans var. lacrymans S7.3]EGO22986.1 hypothetical protein SERLADRAFT_439749 [Serpula lacrymans var. lacrymans S7.9]